MTVIVNFYTKKKTLLFSSRRGLREFDASGTPFHMTVEYNGNLTA